MVRAAAVDWEPMSVATLPPLIQQMLQPDFYPHPVTDPIRVVQTHISYVVLTGDTVYKLKKPVNFGFLDFSDLSQRHFFCQEELRLNRRLSPALYVAVVAIAHDPQTSQYVLTDSEGASPPVEYAVQMRQFDQDGLQLLQQGDLTPGHMHGLAQQVAAFHRTARTDADVQAYSSLEVLRRVEANNFKLSQPYIGRTQTQTQFDQTVAFVDQFVTEHVAGFQQRQTAGYIREGHGDLHLSNICRYQGQLYIFDCIEFNQDFRNIDVIYDIAFLVMDLTFHQRPDLANVFLNTYLEYTGDYSGAQLLPPYLCMRAYIRGNVGSLALDDAAIAPAKKSALLEKAQAYYHLAWTYTQRSQGQLILMSGLSGSGKSTVARLLAPKINAIHIRSDAVRKHLAEIPLDQEGTAKGKVGGGIYTPAMTEKTYTRLLELGLLLAQEGWSVILDAKYDRQALRQKVITQAETHGIPVRILHCTASLPVLRDRLAHRTGDISDATAALLTSQQQAAEPFSDTERLYVTSLQTEQDIASQLAALGF